MSIFDRIFILFYFLKSGSKCIIDYESDLKAATLVDKPKGSGQIKQIFFNSIQAADVRG